MGEAQCTATAPLAVKHLPHIDRPDPHVPDDIRTEVRERPKSIYQDFLTSWEKSVDTQYVFAYPDFGPKLVATHPTR